MSDDDDPRGMDIRHLCEMLIEATYGEVDALGHRLGGYQSGVTLESHADGCTLSVAGVGEIRVRLSHIAAEA
jgi:endonuclease YncB( thermonuclease family)